VGAQRMKFGYPCNQGGRLVVAWMGRGNGVAIREVVIAGCDILVLLEPAW
jgi:hypothetical protein